MPLYNCDTSLGVLFFLQLAGIAKCHYLCLVELTYCSKRVVAIFLNQISPFYLNMILQKQNAVSIFNSTTKHLQVQLQKMITETNNQNVSR